VAFSCSTSGATHRLQSSHSCRWQHSIQTASHRLPATVNAAPPLVRTASVLPPHCAASRHSTSFPPPPSFRPSRTRRPSSARRLHRSSRRASRPEVRRVVVDGGVMNEQRVAAVTKPANAKMKTTITPVKTVGRCRHSRRLLFTIITCASVATYWQPVTSLNLGEHSQSSSRKSFA
jgi:hypothetical protein